MLRDPVYASLAVLTCQDQTMYGRLQLIPAALKPRRMGVNDLRLLLIPVGLLVLPCTRQCRPSPLLPPHFGFPVPDRGTGEGRYLCP